MPDSASDPGGARDATCSGLTRFLVDGPSAADASRETLVEAVRALIRERDYLRRSRDMALADYQQQATAEREHAEELEQLLQRETQAGREQAETLKQELAALRDEVDKLLRERDEILADREAVRADRDEILAARDALRADRDALCADRDAWRGRATRSFAERVRRTLFRSSRSPDEER